MRLRRRPRVDTVKNEVRARNHAWGRWLYLGLVAGFFLWIFDLFVGDMFYFRAEGLVVRDRVVLATQYSASVEDVLVHEGGEVRPGALVLKLRSQRVEESIAELSADLANLRADATRLGVRRRVIQAIKDTVDLQAKAATAARVEAEALSTRSLFTTTQRATLADNELRSARLRAENAAEYAAINRDLPKLKVAVSNAHNALDRLQSTYANGQMQAPSAGVIGYLHVTKGSVVNPGEPLVELFDGTPYVLAYVPEGALYELQPGDEVTVAVGFSQYAGRVSHVYPLTAALPKEFHDAFKQPQRAPIARIDFTETSRYPTLFARTSLYATGWPPAWLKRLLGWSTATTPEAMPATAKTRPLAKPTSTPELESRLTLRGTLTQVEGIQQLQTGELLRADCIVGDTPVFAVRDPAVLLQAGDLGFCGSAPPT